VQATAAGASFLVATLGEILVNPEKKLPEADILEQIMIHS